HENIYAKLAVARSNDLLIAIKEYSLETSFSQKFIMISCSLIASTGASLKLIKLDETREVIGIRKIVYNKIRAKVSVIKHMDFETIATSRNLTLEKAESLKLNLK
ncbi:26180_t:CDS:2, partial [Gigaspora margarita]